MSERRGLDPASSRRVANVVVPTVLTAFTFGVLSRFDLVGNLPLWVLFTLMALAGISGEITGGLLTPDASPLMLHATMAVQILGVTAIIYAIGWGPTLSIGYVFVLARALDTAGSRVWRTALLWTVVGIGLGAVSRLRSTSCRRMCAFRTCTAWPCCARWEWHSSSGCSA